MRSYDQPISPARLGEIMDDSLGALAYHVRTLVKAGVIELADERRVRGAIEHLYALAPEAPEAATQDSRLTRLLGLCDSLTVPAGNGGLPVPVVLDDQARRELQRLLDQLRPRVAKVAAGAVRRG